MEWLVDVDSAFLLGEFKKGDAEIYIEILNGMEMWYTKNTEPLVAKLNRRFMALKNS